MSIIRIVLVEDQALVSDALAQLLGMQDDIVVVGTAVDGLQAQELLSNTSVDLVLTDIEMPNMNGLELCAWLKIHQPQIKTAILTTFNRSGYVQRALQAGARGFILKEVPVETLIQNVRAIAAGTKVYDPDLMFAGLSDQNPLTEREKHALRLAAEGLSTQDIARKMHLTTGTIRNYLSECMGKLYASSRAHAAKIARDKGWL